jgi:hypothetical protein
MERAFSTELAASEAGIAAAKQVCGRVFKRKWVHL